MPALDYLKEKGVKSLYLVGSDYVFPQTANRIIKAYAEANGIEIKGEDYTPLGSTDFSTIVNKVRTADADAVFNTLNGDSNVAFFREYTNVGLTPADMPVVSVSIAEEEVGGIGVQNIDGQLTAWNYYQTIDTPENKKFVEAYKASTAPNKPTSDPMEAAYTSVYLWKNTVEKANSFAVKEIQDNADGVTFDAPEGLVTIDGDNHHITKTARIGEIRPDGLIYTVWDSGSPIEPDPYLKSYPWAGPGQLVRPDGTRRERTSMDVLIGQLFNGIEHRLDPVAGCAGVVADVRPDGRHQHGARRVHHGRLYTAYVVQQVISSTGGR